MVLFFFSITFLLLFSLFLFVNKHFFVIFTWKVSTQGANKHAFFFWEIQTRGFAIAAIRHVTNVAFVRNRIAFILWFSSAKKIVATRANRKRGSALYTDEGNVRFSIFELDEGPLIEHTISAKRNFCAGKAFCTVVITERFFTTVAHHSHLIVGVEIRVAIATSEIPLATKEISINTLDHFFALKTIKTVNLLNAILSFLIALPTNLQLGFIHCNKEIEGKRGGEKGGCFFFFF